jgi:arachidonate 15-lipoxygenase
MSPGGDFDSIFSLTHRGMCTLFQESYDQYDFTVLDPQRDAERRGIAGAGFDTPALANRHAHFDVMHAHTLRYLQVYYPSPTALAGDTAVHDWIQSLDRLVPNGIRGVLGPEITRESLARLVAAFMYMASVEHEILGTGLWNYQMWTHVQPVRVYESGQREPLDVYQRLVNANFNLNVRRAQLVQDWSYLALDAAGAQAFRDYKQALEALQARIAAEPAAAWKISPGILRRIAPGACTWRPRCSMPLEMLDAVTLPPGRARPVVVNRPSRAIRFEVLGRLQSTFRYQAQCDRVLQSASSTKCSSEVFCLLL